MENEENGGNDQAEADEVIPAEVFLEVEDREDHENDQGDHLLDGFQLGGVELAMAVTIGRNLETVFRESDSPADRDGHPEGGGFVFQMSVPGEGHEDIRNGQ